MNKMDKNNCHQASEETTHYWEKEALAAIAAACKVALYNGASLADMIKVVVAAEEAISHNA